MANFKPTTTVGLNFWYADKWLCEGLLNWEEREKAYHYMVYHSYGNNKCN